MMTGRRKTFLQPLRDDDGPVAPTRAPDPDVQITAAFPFKQRNEKGKELFQSIEKALRIRILEDIPADAGIFSSERIEIGDKIRIAQEPHVEQQINVVGHSELVAEGDQRDGEAPARLLLTEMPAQQIAQVMDIEIGGIDDAICMRPDFRQPLSLETDAFQNGQLGQGRMGSA